MTREILFRGKREDNGEWIIGHLLWYEDGKARICATGTDVFCYEKDDSIIQTVAHRVILETVGQYTGLTDKNGVKIFEGDILKIGNKIRYVFFGVSGFRYTNYGEYAADLTVKIAANSEVIGNIHDNPKLLEV